MLFSFKVDGCAVLLSAAEGRFEMLHALLFFAVFQSRSSMTRFRRFPCKYSDSDRRICQKST
jgi:hypothetical protein